MSDFMSNFNPAPFTNNSDHDVIIKSEGSSENLIIPPGATIYGVDGVWVEGVNSKCKCTSQGKVKNFSRSLVT